MSASLTRSSSGTAPAKSRNSNGILGTDSIGSCISVVLVLRTFDATNRGERWKFAFRIVFANIVRIHGLVIAEIKQSHPRLGHTLAEAYGTEPTDLIDLPNAYQALVAVTVKISETINYLDRERKSVEYVYVLWLEWYLVLCCCAAILNSFLVSQHDMHVFRVYNGDPSPASNPVSMIITLLQCGSNRAKYCNLWKFINLPSFLKFRLRILRTLYAMAAARVWLV